MVRRAKTFQLVAVLLVKNTKTLRYIRREYLSMSTDAPITILCKCDRGHFLRAQQVEKCTIRITARKAQV